MEALFYLGECNMFGLGIEKNEKEAIKYYDEAANQGNIFANYRLCDVYRSGIGVEKDIDKALIYNARTRGHGDFNAEITYVSLKRERDLQYRK